MMAGQGDAMKLKMTAIAIALSFLAAGVMADIGFATRAYVVSVDAKAKSMTLKHTGSDNKTWQESVVSWDDKTKWERSDTHIWERTPATADLAKSLKKDDKVYATINDRGGKTLWLEAIRTIPASEKVE
jgi:hypothetical protein